MTPINKDTEIYLNIDGREVGPLAINDLPVNGMTGETLVWWQGEAVWKKADDIPELHKLLHQPKAAPVPPAAPAAPAAPPVVGDAVMNKLMERLAEKDLQLAQLQAQLEEKDVQLATASQAASQAAAMQAAAKATPQALEENEKKSSSVMLLTWIVINVCISLFWLVFSLLNIFDYSNMSSYRTIALGSDIVVFLSWLLVPLAITNKKLKIIGLILAVLLIGYRVCNSIYVYTQFIN